MPLLYSRTEHQNLASLNTCDKGKIKLETCISQGVRVVKELDLSSNVQMHAWVRTPSLATSFCIMLVYGGVTIVYGELNIYWDSLIFQNSTNSLMLYDFRSQS